MTMIARLTGKDLELYINTGFVVDSDNEYDSVDCMVRYDKEEASQEAFSVAKSHDAIFFRDAKGALLKLASSKAFAIEIPRFSAGPRHATFSLGGTASVKARVEAEIGKKLESVTGVALNKSVAPLVVGQRRNTHRRCVAKLREKQICIVVQQRSKRCPRKHGWSCHRHCRGHCDSLRCHARWQIRGKLQNNLGGAIPCGRIGDGDFFSLVGNWD
jgi:hypothetical protein